MPALTIIYQFAKSNLFLASVEFAFFLWSFNILVLGIFKLFKLSSVEFTFFLWSYLRKIFQFLIGLFSSLCGGY